MTTSTATRPRVANFPRTGEPHHGSSGANYSMTCVGPFAELTRYGVRHPVIGQTIHGKVFLQELLGLTGMEISCGLLPPHASIPFFHKHQQNEEVYLFLNGEGQFQVDGQVMPISAGTAVRVSPDGVRACRNTSDEVMQYLVIQAKAGSLEQWTGTDGIGVPGEVTWPEG